MQKVTLQLETLSCPSCIRKIETALTKTNGVQSVKILFNASKVKVEFLEETIKPDDIAKVITQLGYSVENIA